MTADDNDFIGRGTAKADEVRGGDRQCTAQSKSTGVRCELPPIIGGFVCSKHGGSLPQVKESARKRLLALVDPAIDALLRILAAKEACAHCGRRDDMTVIVRAAQIVLDRTGHGPQSEVRVGIADDAYRVDLSEMTDAELAERAENLARQLRAQQPLLLGQGDGAGE